MHHDRIAVGEATVERRGDGGRRVHHEQVAGGEELAEIGEAGVDGIGGAGAHEQPHAVPALPARFGRLVGLVRGVEREVESVDPECARVDSWPDRGWVNSVGQGRGHGRLGSTLTSVRAS